MYSCFFSVPACEAQLAAFVTCITGAPLAPNALTCSGTPFSGMTGFLFWTVPKIRTYYLCLSCFRKYISSNNSNRNSNSSTRPLFWFLAGHCYSTVSLPGCCRSCCAAVVTVIVSESDHGRLFRGQQKSFNLLHFFLFVLVAFRSHEKFLFVDKKILQQMMIVIFYVTCSKCTRDFRKQAPHVAWHNDTCMCTTCHLTHMVHACQNMKIKQVFFSHMQLLMCKVQI